MLTNADLMTIFDFTEDDLAANRAGRISERQLGLLNRQRKDALTCGVLMILFFACIGSIAVAAALSGKPIRGLEHPEVMVLLFVGLVGLFVISTLRQQAHAQTEIRQGVVDFVDGSVTAKRISSGRYVTYKLEVGHKEFPISQKAYEGLNNVANAQGAHMFRVYYSPMKRVMSAEILEA